MNASARSTVQKQTLGKERQVKTSLSGAVKYIIRTPFSTGLGLLKGNNTIFCVFHVTREWKCIK